MTSTVSPGQNGEGGRKGALHRIERFLGSPTLSLICVCFTLLALDVPLWLGVLIIIPFNNYSVKIEQIHASLRGNTL